MDKYEFNLKAQQMKKLAADGRYEEAALIADEIDWSRVKNNRLLLLTADIYEATEQLEKEYDVLEIAYERSPMGKQLAYRLALVASSLKEYDDAEDYYKDYVDMAPKDSRRYLLRYRLSKARGEDNDLLIGLLERYLDDDMEERWTYELCELYAKAGYREKCVNLCDELITWFGDGKYVLAALKLKKRFVPLSVSQQQKYDALMKEDEKNTDDDGDGEFGVEIARARNEIVRRRTLPEKMQEAAEKRIREDETEGTEKAETEKAGTAHRKAPRRRSEEKPAEPEAAEPVAAKPEATKPEAVEPETMGSETMEPEAMEPEAMEPEVMDPEVMDPEAMDPEPVNWEAAEQTQTDPEAESEADSEPDPDFDVDAIQIKTYSDRAYDTMNIQAELAKSMEAILRTEEPKESSRPGKSRDRAERNPEVRTYVPPSSEASEDDVFGYGSERREPEKQITGQMSIEEILKDLQTRGILKEDTVESALRVTGQLPLGKVREKEEAAREEKKNGEGSNSPRETEPGATVTEEEVVKELEAVSLRDFATGEIDLDLVQSEVDGMLEEDIAPAEPEKAESSEEEEVPGDVTVPAEPEKAESAEEERAPEEGTAPAEPEETESAEEERTPEEGTAPAEPEDAGRIEENPEEAMEAEPEEIVEAKPEDATEAEPEEIMEAKPEEATEPEDPTEAEPEEPTKAEEVPEREENLSDAEETGESRDADEYVKIEDTSDLLSLLGLEDWATSGKPEESKESESPEAAEESEKSGESEGLESAEESEESAGSESPEDEEKPEEEADIETDILEDDLAVLGQEENPYAQMKLDEVKRETEEMEDVFAVIKEMETDLSEEDRIFHAYTAEEDKEKRYLNEEDRKEFDQYLRITGMESQIAQAIESYVDAYNQDGTSNCPNILITGGAKTGKTQLAISLIRAINRHLGREGRKTARITGFNLNRKTLSASMPRLVGNDLLIEHAGEINRNIVSELMDILPKYTGGMIVVMEDEKARLDHLFEDYPLLAKYFPNHLDIKEYDINEWAAVAKSYARSQGYAIDELGTLALYAQIDTLYGMLQGLEVEDIKDIVDDAIEHSERRMRATFDRFFGRNKGKNRKILHESDFEA